MAKTPNQSPTPKQNKKPPKNNKSNQTKKITCNKNKEWEMLIKISVLWHVQIICKGTFNSLHKEKVSAQSKFMTLRAEHFLLPQHLISITKK